MEDEEDEVIELDGIRWSWLSPVILATGCVGQMIGSISELFIDMSVVIARHSLWEKDQREFREMVVRDIESITSE